MFQLQLSALVILCDTYAIVAIFGATFARFGMSSVGVLPAATPTPTAVAPHFPPEISTY